MKFSEEFIWRYMAAHEELVKSSKDFMRTNNPESRAYLKREMEMFEELKKELLRMESLGKFDKKEP